VPKLSYLPALPLLFALATGCVAQADDDDESVTETSDDALVAGTSTLKVARGKVEPDGSTKTLQYTPLKLEVAAEDVVTIDVSSYSRGALPSLEILDAKGRVLGVAKPNPKNENQASIDIRFDERATLYVAVGPTDTRLKGYFGVKMKRIFRRGETPEDAWRATFDGPDPSRTVGVGLSPGGVGSLTTSMHTCRYRKSDSRISCGIPFSHSELFSYTMNVASDGEFAFDLNHPEDWPYHPYVKIRGQLLPDGYIVFTIYDYNRPRGLRVRSGAPRPAKQR
jgi:hypothetical protein